MRKPDLRIFVFLLAVILCMAALSFPALADGGDYYGDEIPLETPEPTEPPVPEVTPEPSFTPEGNLSLFKLIFFIVLAAIVVIVQIGAALGFWLCLALDLQEVPGSAAAQGQEQDDQDRGIDAALFLGGLRLRDLRGRGGVGLLFFAGTLAHIDGADRASGIHMTGVALVLAGADGGGGLRVAFRFFDQSQEIGFIHHVQEVDVFFVGGPVNDDVEVVAALALDSDELFSLVRDVVDQYDPEREGDKPGDSKPKNE